MRCRRKRGKSERKYEKETSKDKKEKQRRDE